MSRRRAYQSILDHGHPRTREQPAIDDRASLVVGAAGRALALHMPQANVMDPRRAPFRNALEAKVGILVVAKYKILGETPQLFEP